MQLLLLPIIIINLYHPPVTARLQLQLQYISLTDEKFDHI